LGVSLLQREDARSFEWAFEKFAESMSDGTSDSDWRPDTIFTDSDIAMGAAIKRVWPSTAHLLCVYYINQNLIDHAAQLFPYKKDEKAKVWRCMLTVSKPVLKARLVSAFETKM
jgi:hypothetical protein